MNDLDRQLAELALINKADLQPTSGNNPNKKIGPAVPPKPKKNQPQVPQSYPLKQTVEPSYSSRLQTNQFYSNVPPPPKAPTPQSIYSNSPSSLLATTPTPQSAYSHTPISNLPAPPKSQSLYSNTTQLPGTPNNQALYNNSPTLPSSGKLAQRDIRMYANIGREQSEQGSQYSNFPSRSASAMSNSSVSSSRQANSSQIGHDHIKNSSSPRQNLAANMVPNSYNKSDHVTYSNVQTNEPRHSQSGMIYSNLMHSSRDGRNVYSNLPTDYPGYPNGEDLPPPPPPIDLSSGLADYAPCTVNTNLPPPPEELLPPPSPVSSSYSELRRATQPEQGFHDYGMGSQYGDNDSLYDFGAGSKASSTYESIYEPINPRPPSQISSRSNYSLYAPYVSGASSTMTGPSRSASRMGKEQEVDSLTDLLVQGMSGGVSDVDQEDIYGICIKCGEKIIGENSGCTAMDQLYHTKCFTCHHCAINLQGKPFYALEGNPYCEEDYLNTLEKCCVCQNPILDRILRATGKPYHPKCFCCVVCGKSLDGIPFTVDATNRVHCIEDFHKIFAPRCWVCKQPIMPEPGEEETVRVVALDHSFHIQCYKCEDCGLVLSSEAEGRGCYPLDGHVLCKSCNAKRVQALTSHMTTEL